MHYVRFLSLKPMMMAPLGNVCTIDLFARCSSFTGLLNNANRQNSSTAFGDRSAWHHTSWVCAQLTTVEGAMSMMTMLASGAGQAFSHKQLTIPILAKYLPTFNNQRHDDCKFIYVIIAVLCRQLTRAA